LLGSRLKLATEAALVEFAGSWPPFIGSGWFIASSGSSGFSPGGSYCASPFIYIRRASHRGRRDHVRGRPDRALHVAPGASPGLNGYYDSASQDARLLAFEQLLTFDTGLPLVEDASAVMTQTLTQSAVLAAALKGLPALQTQFPTTGIGKQLQQVAQIIQARAAVGLQRQIFFCSLGGFDTHSDQLDAQVSLLSQLDPAVSAFYNSTVELGVGPNVTSFTLSDSSRTFQPGSNAGTDLAWGSNQWIVGGAAQGGDIFGQFPTLALGGPNDAGNNGRWIPITSVDQCGATLATWFGVQAADLPTIFGNLANFTVPTLGFMGRSYSPFLSRCHPESSRALAGWRERPASVVVVALTSPPCFHLRIRLELLFDA
jgi:hypothetical protein